MCVTMSVCIYVAHQMLLANGVYVWQDSKQVCVYVAINVCKYVYMHVYVCVCM